MVDSDEREFENPRDATREGLEFARSGLMPIKQESLQEG